MAILEEIGVPFDSQKVDYDGGEHRRPHYLHIHPLGLIPALELENGGSMFDSAAIVQFLCDRHVCLAPSLEQPDRPRFLQWLFADLLNTFPHIQNLARGVLAREACSRAAHRHKATTGFGYEDDTGNFA